MQCVIKEMYGEYFCGYVKLPGRAAKRYNSYDRWNKLTDVHGGWTYFDGEWLGFDCSHGFDLKKGQIDDEYGTHDLFQRSYKDIDFVTRELNLASKQILKQCVFVKRKRVKGPHYNVK